LLLPRRAQPALVSRLHLRRLRLGSVAVERAAAVGARESADARTLEAVGEHLLVAERARERRELDGMDVRDYYSRGRLQR